ncbi:MAG: NusG domain II-containing protein [Clostridia bacterium]|nr:NusG domain II-containing protein [Clostridia bacterium]
MLVNRNGNKASSARLPALRLTILDGITAALAVLLALFLLLRPAAADGTVCVITWDGGETVLSLASPNTLVLESRGTELTIVVSEDGVQVTEAGCPDGVCRNTGAIRHAGEIIVCVPADVVIRIPGETKEDFIAG